MSTDIEKREVQRLIRGWLHCERVGHHFFQRDYVLGVLPVGRPYCLWCGAESRPERKDTGRG